jgi:hypothetical protein
MDAFEPDRMVEERARLGKRCVELLRKPSTSARLDVLAAG